MSPRRVAFLPEMMLRWRCSTAVRARQAHDEIEKGTFTLTAASPMYVFHKQIESAAALRTPAGLLITEGFFRADDPYRDEGNEKFREIGLRRVPRGCRVWRKNRQ
jgi:hypothetical protein